MRSQGHGQRKSLTLQLNSTPVGRIELYTTVRTGHIGKTFNLLDIRNCCNRPVCIDF